MHSALKVILIVPLIGLLAGVLGNMELVASLFSFLFGVGKYLLIGIVGLWFLSAIFPRSEGSSESSSDAPLYSHDPWADLQSGHVEQVNKNTTIVHSEGYAFEVTNRFNGDPMVREVDPSNRSPISGWTSGSHRDVKGKAHSVANHIKYVVNTRKGRGGN